MLKPRKAADTSYCDGVSRRSFLQVGALGLAGIALSRLLPVILQPAIGSLHKAIINICLPGGPSHQDMWDMKPGAPVEFRGEFEAIATTVPGIQISELLPKSAKFVDKFAMIRSIRHTLGRHSVILICTRGGTTHIDMYDMKPGAPVEYRCKHQPIPTTVSGIHISEQLPNSAKITGKFAMIRSVCDARLGKSVIPMWLSGGPSHQETFDPNPEAPGEIRGRSMMMARRWIEAGIRFVTLKLGCLVTRRDNEGLGQHSEMRVDHTGRALVTDVKQRGLLDEVWGELGRTPRINYSTGRDHWPQLSYVYIAGGGLQAGQVIGERPVGSPFGRSGSQSVIANWRYGGMSHQDMWEPKPDAPDELRSDGNNFSQPTG